MKIKRLALIVGTALVAMLALSVGTAAAKGVLNLDVPGSKTPVPDKTKVSAGWYLGIGESYACQLLPEEEGEPFAEESMKLETNAAVTDIAKGSVAAPPCFEVEAEPGVAAAKRARHHALRRHVHATVEPFTLTGTMSEQQISVKKKGTIELSKPLVFTLNGTLTCVYESKTALKATWPPEANEEFPNITKTADLVSEGTLKLSKAHSAKKGCAKSEEVYVEAWVGPLGEELEAELAA